MNEVQKCVQRWCLREGAGELGVRCERKSWVTGCGCRLRAKKCGRICEVLESRVPNCRQSHQVWECEGY